VRHATTWPVTSTSLPEPGPARGRPAPMPVELGAEPRFDFLAWNDPFDRLWKPGSLPERRRNTMWLYFAKGTTARRTVGWQERARHLLGQFRAAAAEHSGDERFAELVTALQEESERFCEWWEPLQRRAGPHRKDHCPPPRRRRHPDRRHRGEVPRPPWAHHVRPRPRRSIRPGQDRAPVGHAQPSSTPRPGSERLGPTCEFVRVGILCALEWRSAAASGAPLCR
jgi:hypothetical protein